MGPALGIAASLLTDVGFKALKQLTSGKKSQETTQAGITDPTSSAGQTVPGKASRPDFNQMFAKIDADGDSSISKAEFMAFKQKIDDTLSSLLKTQEEAASSAGDSAAAKAAAAADKTFSALDTNKDGQVSKEELAAVIQHGRGQNHASGQHQENQGGGSPASFLSALLNIQAQSASA